MMQRFYVIGIGLLLLILSPILLWWIQPYQKLQVAVIDKTVPTQNYREHQGLMWVLNQSKYVTGQNQPYDPETNYFGYQPDTQKEKPLPNDYSAYDVIYLADTYGVYQDDMKKQENSRAGARSEKIYGGLEEDEWNAIMKRFMQKKKGLLVAEFNSFASPTNETVRKSMTDYLGVNGSGWMGRYFDELDPEQNQEIPQWILDHFREKWNYSGPGFILVNDLTSEVLVLESNKHINGKGISVSFTKEGKNELGKSKSSEYGYWFDIATSKSSAVVLANYKWNLTKDGEKLLEDKNIPTQFAAVIKNQQGASTSYYFAGDFNDVGNVPQYYEIKGLEKIYKIVQAFSDDAFYWSAYVPMMKSILKDFDKKESLVSSTPTTLQYQARIHDQSFEVLKDGQWTPMTIKGVNMGMGKPGYFPGEAAITEEEYDRWFEQIGVMNANTIRIYTLHPPGFYHALKRYNESHENKIYVLHGVWINEEQLLDSLDAFEEKNRTDFQDEMRKIVDVIHGNKIVEAKPGHASGMYDDDISQYVIGWIIGIEWNPQMVVGTNEKHASIGDYNGDYFQTKHGQPFEYWLAQQMDTLVKYEKDQYNWIRPVSFTNWVTTDLLDHPSEPDKDEDLVSVNPNVIYTKNEMELTEQFASYHIYPYYPDSFNYDENYLKFVDHRGEQNSYAAYLSELHAAHRLPILVAEFGVPSSRGLTHANPFGWNQGFLSEKEQGELISHMYEDIMAEKLLGGLIFTWQDEWFKRTWNTMDYDLPDRRPYWSNAQTNEQQFGLLSFDRHKIQVDGDLKDWKTQSQLYRKKDGDIASLYIDHDERYLYIRLDVQRGSKGYPILLLDTVPNQGNTFIKGKEGTDFQNGIDFIVNLNDEEPRVMVDEYYNLLNFQYGHQLNLLKPKPNIPVKNSGLFSPIQYALNKELYLPAQDAVVPFTSYETGKLRKGNANPLAKDYDSLTDFTVNEDGTIELRIPWLLIQAKDPSQKEFTGDLYENGMDATTKVEQIYIGALYVNEADTVIDSFPAEDKESHVLAEMKGYTWDNWNAPQYQERLKQSYKIVQELFARTEGR